MTPELYLPEEAYETIELLAGHNYGPEKIALFLSVDKKAFLSLWFDPTSPVRKAYDRGAIRAEFNVLNKQREDAESGNATAAQIFLKETAFNRIATIRNHSLFAE